MTTSQVIADAGQCTHLVSHFWTRVYVETHVVTLNGRDAFLKAASKMNFPTREMKAKGYRRLAVHSER